MPFENVAAKRGCRGDGLGSLLPDGVTSSQSNPLWDRTILLLGSCELLLRAEGLVALYCVSSASVINFSVAPRRIGVLPLSATILHPISIHTQKQFLNRVTYRHRD